MIYSYFRVLREKNFFFLWFSQIISQFGDRLTQMALIGLVYKLRPGSSIELAKMLSLAIIPVFLISPVAGVYIDRWNKRKTMYSSDLLRGIFIITIPFAFWKFQSLGIIYLLVFFSFCFGRFFIPAKMAIIPHLVKKGNLFLANSLVSTTAMIAAVLGFGLGGLIVEKWGVWTAFMIDAFTFFFSAFFILLMQVEEKASFKPQDLLYLSKDAILNVKRSFLTETKEGLKYILGSPETKYAARVFFALFAAIGSLYTTFIVFIQDSLSTVTADLGWLAVGAGAGLFIGSMLYGRIGRKFPVKKVINTALAAASLYLIIFTYILKSYPDKIFALSSCFILGVIVSPVVIAVNTMIHTESENNFWGRIFCYLEVIIHLAFIVFMFTASFIAEKLSSPFTIIISVGIIILFLSLFNLIKENGTHRGT